MLTKLENCLASLRRFLPEDRIETAPSSLFLYNADGLSIGKASPELLVFPETTDEVVAIVKTCLECKIPYVPRGAGTGLSGGAIPLAGGVLVVLTRMRKILDVDFENGCITVEPGVVNLDVSKAVVDRGFHFAPDPSSQQACTLGGNVAENSGGPHTLKYGVTSNHILGLEVVLPDGTVETIGGKAGPTNNELDLISLIVGSEGLLGIVTKVICRLTRNPQTTRTFLLSFHSVSGAVNTVSAIVAAGIIPAALEMIDNVVLDALNQAFGLDLNPSAGAFLLVELDGLKEAVDEEASRFQDLAKQEDLMEFQIAQNAEERNKLWAARKKAFGALGRVSPNYYTQDGVVPRSKLPAVLEEIRIIASKHNLKVANIFHAGDGNLHPCILFNRKHPGEMERVLKASREILKTCVDYGGTVSGEHGIGLEKREYLRWIFSDQDLAFMTHVKRGFDPANLLNPEKVIPSGANCVDAPVINRQVAV